MRIRFQLEFAARFALVAVSCSAFTGCRHKPTAVYVPLPVATPVALTPAPEPPLMAQLPVEPAPPLPVKVAPKKVRKQRKKPVVVVPVAPVEVASVAVAPAEAIGALTAGGSSSPAKLQEASEMIAGLEKRIAGLPSDWKTKQKVGLVRVRYFVSQAQVALKGGDGEGAVTLATKAKLLLEDLVK